jgi:hypothetical protein
MRGTTVSVDPVDAVDVVNPAVSVDPVDAVDAVNPAVSVDPVDPADPADSGSFWRTNGGIACPNVSYYCQLGNL